MSPSLIIDNQARALMSVALSDAHQNVIPYSTVRSRAEALENGSGASPLPMDRDRTVQLPTCYEATYAIEEHAPGVPCRHLCISMIGDAESGPHPMVVDEIMREFGFQGSREDVVGWLQMLDDNRFAVNVLEPVDGDWEKLTSSNVAPHNTSTSEARTLNP